jgi:hypothetical protein
MIPANTSQRSIAMTRQTVLRVCAPLLLVAGGVLASAQVPLPSAPQKRFGTSISPAFEGWYNNPDGTHTFLIGYYNRNTDAEIDIPIGANNRFEPGNPDMGQPTHFLTRRRYGMFIVTVPKEFTRTQKITWTLTVNGVTNTTPFYMHTDYNVTPFKSSEESHDGMYNTPPVLRLEENGPSFQGPAASVAKALSRTATAGTPMPLDLWADDDALYSSGGGATMTNARPPVTLTISKYRGPGDVTIADRNAKFEALKGGKPDEAFSGRASTKVAFSQAGDYLLHVTANDYSGNGGGGSVCCWTTAMIKVAVTPGGPSTNGAR